MNTQVPNNRMMSNNNTVMALNNMMQTPNMPYLQNNQKFMGNPMMMNINNNMNYIGMQGQGQLNYGNNFNMPPQMMNQMNPMHIHNQLNPMMNQPQVNSNNIYYNHSNFVFKDYFKNLQNEKKFVMNMEF